MCLLEISKSELVIVSVSIGIEKCFILGYFVYDRESTLMKFYFNHIYISETNRATREAAEHLIYHLKFHYRNYKTNLSNFLKFIHFYVYVSCIVLEK